MILSTVEMHTGGEPTRIIIDGWPEFVGKTLLEKRREAKERFDAPMADGTTLPVVRMTRPMPDE